MAATALWDISNLKAVQIELDRFGKGKVVVNGTDITEKIEELVMTSVTGSHVVLSAVLVQPLEAVEPEPVVEDVELKEPVPETEVEPPEIPDTPDEGEGS